MSQPENAQKTPPGLLRSAGVASIAISASRVTGLVRESVLSWLFGASATYDAYVVGYRIPNLARDLFGKALSPPRSYRRLHATSPPKARRKRANWRMSRPAR